MMTVALTVALKQQPHALVHLHVPEKVPLQNHAHPPPSTFLDYTLLIKQMQHHA